MEPRLPERWCCAALLSLLTLGVGSAEATPRQDRGTLVAIGGALADDHTAIRREILATRLPERPLCILATASGQPRRALRATAEPFRRLAGDDAILPIALDLRHPKRVDQRRWVRRLEGCGGFFFTGGDQSRLVALLRPDGTPSLAEQTLEFLLRRGAGVAGTSAGAAMLSQPMIADGQSLEAWRHGVTRVEGEPGVLLGDGLGLLPEILVDQHFFARGRFGRLLVALQGQTSLRYGVGIAEDTALVVHQDRARVVGRSAVLVIDRLASRTQVWLLGNGDRLKLATGQATPADDKRPVPPMETLEPAVDLWQGAELLHQLVGFARAEHTTWTFDTPAGPLSLTKAPGFRQVGRGTAEDSRALFAGPFLLAPAEEPPVEGQPVDELPVDELPTAP